MTTTTLSKYDQAVRDIQDFRKKLNWYPSKNNSSNIGGANVLCGYISEGGESIHRTYPCHRPINSFTNAEVLWSCFGWRGKKEIGRAYFNWLIHDSPWARTGIVPDGLSEEFLFNEGFVFRNLKDTSCNLLHNFLVASRSCAEWPQAISTWHQLVSKHGVNPTLAYLFLSLFRDTAGQNAELYLDKNNYYLTNADKYDWPLDMARATDMYVKNFLVGNPVGKSKQMFYPSAQTAPVNTLWGNLVSGPDDKNSYVSLLRSLYQDKFATEQQTPSFLQRYDQVTGKRIVGKTMIYTSKDILEILKLEQERLKDFIRKDISHEV